MFKCASVHVFVYACGRNTRTHEHMNKKKRVVVAIGGSSGSIYAKILLDRLVQLKPQVDKVGIVMSNNAKFNWEYELENKDFEQYPFDYFEKMDFMAPFASGSARYDTMIVCPCSMGLLGRIAAGIPITAEQQVEEIFPLPRQLVGKGELFMLKVVGEFLEAAVEEVGSGVGGEVPKGESGGSKKITFVCKQQETFEIELGLKYFSYCFKC